MRNCISSILTASALGLLMSSCRIVTNDVVSLVEASHAPIEEKIAVLQQADPVREANTAFERNDHRFLDIGEHNSDPSVNGWNCRLTTKYGKRRLGSEATLGLPAAQEAYRLVRDGFASAYNKQMLARLGETDSVLETRPKTNEDRFKALIECLAISDEPAGNAAILTPSRDTPSTDKRAVAFDAVAELQRFGTEAFPALIAARNDKRQSIALRAVIPHTVGLACHCIVENQIVDLPGGFGGCHYWQRTGADGREHDQPSYFKERPLEEWWPKNAHRTLLDLRIEALEWQIAEENRIGFTEEKQRERFLYPLQYLLSQLRAGFAAGRQTPKKHR